MVIKFTIRAIDEAAFRQRWIAAGILDDTPGYVFRPAYPGIELTATQGWSGIIDGIPGWHCNARVEGALADAMTASLAQIDADGNPLPLFNRTWAAYIFGLTEIRAVDPASGFPYGAKTVDDAVQYGDPADLSSPANVRQ